MIVQKLMDINETILVFPLVYAFEIFFFAYLRHKFLIPNIILNHIILYFILFFEVIFLILQILSKIRRIYLIL